MPSLVSQLTRILILSAVLFTIGCAAIDETLFFAEQKLLGANGSAVNGIKIRAAEDGFELRSAGVVRGTSGVERDVANWLHYAQVSDNGLISVELLAAEPDYMAVSEYLNSEHDECGNPRDQLTLDLRAVSPLLMQLTAQSELPRVSLRLVSGQNAIKYYAVDRAASIARLNLYLTQPLPPQKSCTWIKFWSAQMVELIVHELVHIHVFQAFGDVDRVSNEIAAYGSELCVQLRLRGTLLARRTFGPEGTNSDSLEDVIGWYRSGRMSASMAGNFLSDRLRRLTMGDRPLQATDLPKLEGFCKRLTQRMVDVESSSDVAYVTQR